MENLPLVSIALCTYNGAKYLKEQLDSIINQTYSNIEIIAVDDCSTDETYSILKEYSNQFSSIKVFQNNINLGYVKNFEKAISLCKGEYVALSDQDDIWNTEKIKLQVEEIGNNILIYHDSEFISENGNKLNKKMSDIVNFYKGNQSEFFLFFNCISSHSILFKNILIKYLIPFTSQNFHDAWIAYVAANIGSIGFLKQCLVSYRQHESTSTDILKTRKPQYKISREEKIKDTLIWLNHCASFKNNRNQRLINLISKAFEKSLHSGFNFQLFLIFLTNLNRLCFIYKKPRLNKINFAFRNSWGVAYRL